MENREIQGTIIREIKRTEKHILDNRDLTGPVAPDVAIGRISRLDAINNKSVTEAAFRQTEEKLSKLKIVLSRVASPGFGKCVKWKRIFHSEESCSARRVCIV